MSANYVLRHSGCVRLIFTLCVRDPWCVMRIRFINGLQHPYEDNEGGLSSGLQDTAPTSTQAYSHKTEEKLIVHLFMSHSGLWLRSLKLTN